MSRNTETILTKQKILGNAVHLFAIKGYTETSMRELAAAVGLKEASIYNHFPSKNAILEYIIAEYMEFTKGTFLRDKLSELKKNPNIDGIMACMMFEFPKGKEEYYLKVLYVILQEQHRNPLIRRIVCEEYIQRNEQAVKAIIDALKELNVLRPDTDPDFWIKAHSSLLYTFASRRLLGIGDNLPEFSGRGLADLMLYMYEMLLATCSVEKGQNSSPPADVGE